jgi:cytochrome b561
VRVSFKKESRIRNQPGANLEPFAFPLPPTCGSTRPDPALKEANMSDVTSADHPVPPANRLFTPADHLRVPRYALVPRLLHWLIATLVLLALAFGWTIGYFGFGGLRETFGAAGTDFIYTTHKTLGVLILGFMVLRLLSRFAFGKPPYATPLPAPQRIASQLVHWLFYALLIVMPILGWLATASGGFPVHLFHIELPGLIDRNDALSETLFLWHRYVGYTIAGLVVLHVSGALYHWLGRRDEVMQRMALFR